ncbi:MAG: Abi family protein [Spirochaetia bacterium]
MNYYRLSAYLFPYRRNDGTEQYKPSTNLDSILEIYRFDEELRNTLVAGLERIEVSFRTNVAYHFSHACGPFGYVDRKNLPDLNDHTKLLYRMQEEKDKTSEAFKDHFVEKYGDKHEYLPLWMAVELMSFGTLHHLLRGIDHKIRQAIASEYGIDQVVLQSWFLSLNTLRNLCAHHSRIWNRTFGVKPRIPYKNDLWTKPVLITNDHIFGLASVLAYLGDQIENSKDWKGRFLALINRCNETIPLFNMGFPSGWENSGIWK